MKKGYSVEVSDANIPVFPEHCVFCTRPHGEQLGTLEISPLFGKAFSQGIGFSFYPAGGDASKKQSVCIPAHDQCIKEIKTRFWIRNLLPLLVALPVLITSMSGNWNNMYILLIGLVAAAPLVFWEVTHPVPIGYEHGSGYYIFTFRDRNYAEVFAQQNNAVIKKVS